MAKKDVTVRGNTYFKEAWNMRGMAKWAREQLPSSVDTLVGTGMSGTLIVPRLAERLGLAWGVVRKPGVSSHAGSTTFYEGQMGRHWAFVDDFICSGDTLVRVIDVVEEEFHNYCPDRYPWKKSWRTDFAGALCYSNWGKPHGEVWKGVHYLSGRFYSDRRDRLVRLTAHSASLEAEQLRAAQSGAVISTPLPALGESPSPALVPCSPFPVL